MKFAAITARTLSATSLPSRERGLKLPARYYNIIYIIVAPFTGAWIEMVRPTRTRRLYGVAPFTGAWIEIRAQFLNKVQSQRRSLHGSVD